MLKLAEKKGFTLLEVTVVIAIIAVMAMVAVPTSLKILEKSKISTTVVNIQSIKTAAVEYYTDNSDWPQSADDFTGESNGGPYMERWPDSSWKNSDFVWDHDGHKIQVTNLPADVAIRIENMIGGSYSGTTFELEVR